MTMTMRCAVIVLMILPILQCASVSDDGTHGEKGDFRKPDVIWVPTPPAVIDKMLRLVSLKKGDLLYDLGCGDGRIVVAAAEKYGVKAVGFELDPFLVDEARTLAKDRHVEHLVTIERADIFTLDLSKATVITLYLLPEMNEKLIPQLKRCRPGTRIVAHDFGIKGTEPDKKFRIGDSVVYFWKAPIKMAKTPSSTKITPVK